MNPNNKNIKKCNHLWVMDHKISLKNWKGQMMCLYCKERRKDKKC